MCEGRFIIVLKKEKPIPEKYNCRLMMVGNSADGKKKSDSLLEFGPRTRSAGFSQCPNTQNGQKTKKKLLGHAPT